MTLKKKSLVVFQPSSMTMWIYYGNNHVLPLQDTDILKITGFEVLLIHLVY